MQVAARRQEHFLDLLPGSANLKTLTLCMSVI
jgi:hypothetical protein